MDLILRDSVTRIWLLLLALTAGSWALGTGNGGLAASAGILALACFKIRLVMLHFMEVQEAPPALRWTCEGWIVAMLGTLLWMYR